MRASMAGASCPALENLNAAAVGGGGDGASELGVDAQGDALRIVEIGIAQEQGESGEIVQVGRDIALGDGTVDDASDGRVVELLAVAAASGAVAANDEWALRGGIDLSVFPAKGSEQKSPAVEGFGVADGGDEDVDLGSGAGEGGQRGGHEDGGDILDHNGGGVGGMQAHAQHDVGEHLNGEEGLLLISGVVQADDQAVADERIVTHPLDGGDLANAHLARRGRRRVRGEERSPGRGGEQQSGAD